jgi:2-amino-4-hydroxy-6-hydroxymethyldihydropteridine diphosphokinase
LTEAYVALGANIGDRGASLREAVRRLEKDPDVRVLRLSSVYETDPVGFEDQPAFLNMALAVETSIEPLKLLRKLLAAEREMGRVRDIRWGPRVIDLDLILYGDVSMETEELELPHPRMGERAFVLAPLRDIWPAGQSFPWTIEQAGIRLWGSLLISESEHAQGSGKDLPSC